MSDAWYWDLSRLMAVRADQRGPSHHTLGPYPSREAAENWKQTSEARQDRWDADDDAWESWDTPSEQGERS